MISANARFALVALALAGAALFMQTRTRHDVLPPGPPLSSLPLQFAGWQGADLPFAPQTLAVLGPGEFLQRQYRRIFVAVISCNECKRRTGPWTADGGNGNLGAGVACCWISIVRDSIAMTRHGATS